VRTLTKCPSLNSLSTLHKLQTQLLHFWFQRFRSVDKIDEDYALVHLVLSPHPRNVSARSFSPWPSYILKSSKGMAFLRHVLFFLSDIWLLRYDSAGFGPILKKILFTQQVVVHCDPRKAAQVLG
jgi:hypothetical protein